VTDKSVTLKSGSVIATIFPAELLTDTSKTDIRTEDVLSDDSGHFITGIYSVSELSDGDKLQSLRDMGLNETKTTCHRMNFSH